MALSPTLCDRSCGLTYAEWLRSKNLQTRPNGWTNATRDVVTEGVDSAGQRFKVTRDQLGNDVKQFGTDGQSVRINRPETVRAVIPRPPQSKEEG